MSDRLAEALDWYDNKQRVGMEGWTDVQWIVKAARAFAEPLWEGDWCEPHLSTYNDGAPGCEFWMAVKEGGGQPSPCSIVRGVRVVPNVSGEQA